MENARGNLANAKERGEHEHQWLTYGRFEPSSEENDDRTREFDVEVDLELTGDRRPRNQGFPVLWSRGLVKERSRRKLEMWRNFGYGGFGSYEEKLANRAGERELFQTPSMAN